MEAEAAVICWLPSSRN